MTRPCERSEDMSAAATEDSLLGGKLKLRQPRVGYRVAIDPVLLAASVVARPGEKILDLGCGVGTVSLCLAWRLPSVELAGLDLDEDLVALANHNAGVNGYGRRLRYLAGDLRRPPAEIAAGGFDQVLANPPYLEAGRSTPPSPAGRRTANIEGEAALADWIAAMLYLVQPKGRLTLIHRADRVDDILRPLDARAGEITIFPLWPRRRVLAKRVIVSARREVYSPTMLQPGLVLHAATGNYTAAANAVLRRGRALPMHGDEAS